MEVLRHDDPPFRRPDGPSPVADGVLISDRDLGGSGVPVRFAGTRSPAAGRPDRPPHRCHAIAAPAVIPPRMVLDIRRPFHPKA